MNKGKVKWVTADELEALSRPMRSNQDEAQEELKCKILDLMEFVDKGSKDQGCEKPIIGRPRTWQPEYLAKEYAKYLGTSNVCKKSVTDFVKKMGISRRNFYYLINCAK